MKSRGGVVRALPAHAAAVGALAVAEGAVLAGRARGRAPAPRPRRSRSSGTAMLRYGCRQVGRPGPYRPKTRAHIASDNESLLIVRPARRRRGPCRRASSTTASTSSGRSGLRPPPSARRRGRASGERARAARGGAGSGRGAARPSSRSATPTWWGERRCSDRRRDVFARQPHERAGRRVVADGVHEDGVARRPRGTGGSERPSVPPSRTRRLVGRLPVAVEPGDGGRAEAVVAAEEVAEPENEQAALGSAMLAPSGRGSGSPSSTTSSRCTNL